MCAASIERKSLPLPAYAPLKGFSRRTLFYAAVKSQGIELYVRNQIPKNTVSVPYILYGEIHPPTYYTSKYTVATDKRSCHSISPSFYLLRGFVEYVSVQTLLS